MNKSEEILSEEIFFINNLDRNEYTREHMLKSMKAITTAFAKWLKEQHVMIVQSAKREHTYCSTFIGGPQYTEEQLWDIFNEGKNCES